MKKRKIKPVYFHTRQIEFAQAPQRVKVMVAPRGWGKSTEIALITYDWVRLMPRGKAFFAATTFEQIDNNVLPPVREKWAELGLIEGIHYVVGKRPPEKWWLPYKPVKKYDRVITFFNGFTILLISGERMNARRGGSFDCGIIDEAAFFKYAAFKSVLSASIRGNLGRFPKSVHRSLILFTSRPRKIEQQWIYVFRELAKKKPETVLYVEGGGYDNKALLGEDWYEEQRDNMGDIEYLIEVMNQDIQELPNGFYNKYSSHIHEYVPSRDVRDRMTDIEPNQLLEISLDYGGWFSCFVVFQEDYESNVEYLRRRYWIKTDNIEDLVDKFCDDNKGHQFKYVRIWGEPRMWDRTAKGKIINTITQRFEHHGWSHDVMTQPGYRTELHKEQYQFMLRVLDHKDESLPELRINRDACADTITALKMADVKADMTLDKDNEKKKKEFPQEHATHQPQAINYYFMQKHGHKVDDGDIRPGEVDFS
jgi:hypothetical protein